MRAYTCLVLRSVLVVSCWQKRMRELARRQFHLSNGLWSSARVGCDMLRRANLLEMCTDEKMDAFSASIEYRLKKLNAASPLPKHEVQTMLPLPFRVSLAGLHSSWTMKTRNVPIETKHQRCYFTPFSPVFRYDAFFSQTAFPLQIGGSRIFRIPSILIKTICLFSLILFLLFFSI